MIHTKLPPNLALSPLQIWSFVYRPKQFFTQLQERYGDVVTIQAPHTSLVMTLTPVGAGQVLTAPPDQYGSFQKEAFQGLAGEHSLFVLEGDRHRDERKLLLPAFHTSFVKHYGPAIQAIVRAHLDHWYPGQQFRARNAMLALSRDIILRVVFGHEFDLIKESGRLALRDMLNAAHPLLEYLPELQSFWFPPWRRFQKAKKDFNHFARQALNNRRQQSRPIMNVLDRLIAATDDAGQPRSEAAILDELYTVLLPGHATTGVALAWALYELGQNPEVLARLREEIKTLGPDPDPVSTSQLPYLGAVCDETMRLHTIVTETARMQQAPRQLLGYTIPAGVGIGISICAIHQNPDLYPEPDRFLPERFLERHYSSFEFLPFGGGHRRCLGNALSNFEMRVALSMIVSEWEFENLGTEREVRHNLGMGPKHGVMLRIKERLH